MIQDSVIHFLDVPPTGMGGKRASVDLQDALNFQSALKGDQQSAITILENPLSNSNIAGPEMLDGFFDPMIQKLHAMSAQAQNEHEQIMAYSTKAENEGISTEDIVQLNLKLFHYSFQVEMTSKVARKTDEGIQTLFKQQG